MGKKTVALNEEQYITILETIKNGFEFNGRKYKPNRQVLLALQLEGNLGMRIGDILDLRLNSIIKDGDRYVTNVYEEKTNKYRKFTVVEDIYEMIYKYFVSLNIRPNDKLFTISVRQVQRFLADVCKYLGYENISTHSFRKYCASNMYKNSDYDIELVRNFLQHSSIATTQRYVGLGSKKMEDTIKKTTHIVFTDI